MLNLTRNFMSWRKLIKTSRTNFCCPREWFDGSNSAWTAGLELSAFQQWIYHHRISLKYLKKNENEEHWFPQIPDEYLKQLGYAAPQRIQTPTFTPFEGVLHPGGETTNRTPDGPPGQDDAGQSIVRKSSNNTAFERFKNLNIPISTIWRRLRDNPNMTRPPASPGDSVVEMCLVFHIKGLCNTCCGRALNHVVHTKKQDAPLVIWYTECYTVAWNGGKMVDNIKTK